MLDRQASVDVVIFLFLVDGLINELVFTVLVNCIFVGYTLMKSFLGNFNMSFNKISLISKRPIKQKVIVRDGTYR